MGHLAGSCECGNELPVSIKFGEFVYYLTTYWVLNKYSAPWGCYLFIQLVIYIYKSNKPEGLLAYWLTGLLMMTQTAKEFTEGVWYKNLNG